MILGQLIAAYRERNGYGLREFAINLNISFPTLSRIERGHDCDSATLAKLLEWMLRPTPYDGIDPPLRPRGRQKKSAESSTDQPLVAD